MPATEKRFPRETFTRKLVRICECLDESSKRAVQFRHFLFREQMRTAVAEISAVWVVGSYARGAADCGDLDVILTLVPTKDSPPRPALTRTFFGPLAYVRYYEGDPQKNTSGVAFPDALQIWNGPKSDWRAVIAAIQVNPEAGRAPRELDVVPLRLEQLYEDTDSLKELVDQMRSGHIQWDFEDFDAKDAAGEQSAEPRLDRYTHDWGKQSKRLLPHLKQKIPAREPFGEWEWDSGGQLAFGGTEIYVGRPVVPINRLNGLASVQHLALVPHISTRGPNGIWWLKRGPSHPDSVALQPFEIFVVVENGDLIVSERYDHSRWSKILVLEIHLTAEEARAEADAWGDDPNFKIEVQRLQGDEIFHATANCDVLALGRRKLPVTWDGARFLKRSKHADIAAVVKFLAVK